MGQRLCNLRSQAPRSPPEEIHVFRVPEVLRMRVRHRKPDSEVVVFRRVFSLDFKLRLSRKPQEGRKHMTTSRACCSTRESGPFIREFGVDVHPMVPSCLRSSWQRPLAKLCSNFGQGVNIPGNTPPGSHLTNPPPGAGRRGPGPGRMLFKHRKLRRW